MRSAISGSLVADEPADDVGVAAEVLRGRVHDDVGAELERSLQVRRGERVVDDDARAALVRELARPPRCRRCVSAGLVGVSTHTTVVPSGQSRVERVEVGEVGDGPLDARRREHLRHQAEGAAVRVVGDDHVVAGREQRAAPRPPRPCRSRTRSRRARPRATRGTPRARARVGLPLRRVLEARVLPHRLAARTSSRGVIGRDDRAGRGVGRPGPSWIARVSKPSAIGVAHDGRRGRRGTSTRRSG